MKGPKKKPKKIPVKHLGKGGKSGVKISISSRKKKKTGRGKGKKRRLDRQ